MEQNTKTGKLKVVAKTGGLQFEGEDGVWYNGVGNAKEYAKKMKVGATVEIRLTEKPQEFEFIRETEPAPQQAQTPHPSKYNQNSKDDYWANKEKRDIENSQRISRHGAINTALEVIKVSKHADMEKDAVMVAAKEIAEEILLFVNKENTQ